MLVLSDTVYANKDHRTMNSSLGGRHYVCSSSTAHVQTISTLPLHLSCPSDMLFSIHVHPGDSQ